MSNLPYNFHQPAPGPSPGGRESRRAAAGWWPILLMILWPALVAVFLWLTCGCEVAAGYEDSKSVSTNGTEKAQYKFKGEASL